jgi:WD40 repeat protein
VTGPKAALHPEVRVLSVGTLRSALVPLANQSGWISALAVTPDGRTLAVGDSDGGLVLCDLFDGQRLGPSLRADPGAVLGLAWMPDGSLEVRSPETTTLWHANPGSWHTQACAVANRNLTCSEWRRYLGGEPYRATCPSLPAPPCDAK